MIRRSGFNDRDDLNLKVSLSAFTIGVIAGAFFLIDGLTEPEIQFSPGGGVSYGWKIWFGAILITIGVIAGAIWNFSKHKRAIAKRKPLRKKKR